ncbi:IS1096 element passenger TnpR family protein [Kitasatospora sp. NPDC001660]
MRQTTEHQLKIVLLGTKPPVWRRVLLASDVTLGSLHEVIQRAFGWTESHLHGFEDGLGREYGPADAAEESYFGSVDEESVSVADVLPEVGDRLDYTYDFGDDWVHRVTVEKVLPTGSGERVARCVGGRRADPPAEDIGGPRGMETVLAMLADPEPADSEEVYADLVGELRERGHDPAAFDAREVSRALESLALRTPGPAGRRRNGGKDRALARRDGPRPTEADLVHCTCGQCRVGDHVRSSPDLGGFPDGAAEPELLPAVSLPPRAELAATARAVPLFDAASRLAAWCGDGRKVTAKGVLRPALAREAVEELELWRLDEEFEDPEERAGHLGAMRSAGDLPIVDDPWQLAVAGGLVEIASGAARCAVVDDDMLLTGWEEALGEELLFLAEETASGIPGLLGNLLPVAPDTVIKLLRLLYALPEGEWLDKGTELVGMTEGASARAVPLLEVMLSALVDELADVLERLGAAEVEWGDRPDDPEAAVLGILLGSPAAPLVPRQARQEAGAQGRLRLTRLGRHGLREFLLELGDIAPLVGEHADADAATLLDALPAYSPEAAAQEVHGWLARRTQADAAVQLIDACTGTDAGSAMRRSCALPVLTRLEEERALRVLRKAAASEVDGCRQLAAGALFARGEETDGHDGLTTLWLTVDTFAAMAGLDTCELAEFLGEADGELCTTLSLVADELWRSGHPSAADVLTALGDALRDVDKKLAKRLRTSANKARSRR